MSLVGVKPGDCLYVEDNRDVISVYAVERVTKTQVICNDNRRFQLATGLFIGSGSSYHRVYADVVTPEVKQRLHRQRCLIRLRQQLEVAKIQTKRWTTEELVRLHDELKKIHDRLEHDEALRAKIHKLREESDHD